MDEIRTGLANEVKLAYENIANLLTQIEKTKIDRKAKLNSCVDLEERLNFQVKTIGHQIYIAKNEINKMNICIQNNAKSIAHNRKMIKFKESLCKFIFKSLYLKNNLIKILINSKQ
jgi:hypothetical protein